MPDNKGINISHEVGQKILKVFTDHVKHDSWWQDYFKWKEIVDKFMERSKENETKYHATATNIFIALNNDKKDREINQRKSSNRFWFGVTSIGILEFVANIEKICSVIKEFIR